MYPGHPEFLPAVGHTPNPLPRQVPPSTACYNLSTSLLLLSEVSVCTPNPILHKDEYKSQLSQDPWSLQSAVSGDSPVKAPLLGVGGMTGDRRGCLAGVPILSQACLVSLPGPLYARYIYWVKELDQTTSLPHTPLPAHTHCQELSGNIGQPQGHWTCPCSGGTPQLRDS